ncbi:hypothetical protein PISL3812_05022 [Talaromyces islandicus]|uniref:Insulin-induced gene 2 protein n=1 Tax=Talaromyces islandicus TaxID=28573 RepID=A0A0U1LX80_TALIS|nr:hypothetical protein PISL3812_05022 [Talaromyces islandicus]
MTDSPRLLRPKARRPFELPSNESSRPPSPPIANTANTNGSAADFLDVKSDLDGKRTGSLLNLTSSTLLGIFQQTAFDSGRDENSPWDTQVHTPIETDVNNRFPSSAAGGAKTLDAQMQPQPHQHTRRTVNAVFVPLISKTSLLFVCGVVYGTIMAHLHENNWITPVKLELIDRNSYVYLAAWGFGGVSLAYVLPWLDNLWENASEKKKRKPFANGYQKVGGRSGDSRPSRWTLAVRSIGAFVGIAFAMRRLPWESTTQESLTLALVNPFLWYLIDRTKTGFWLSTVVALTGMGITLALHPEIIPSSSAGGLGLRNGRLAFDIQGGLSQEGTAVAIWLASAFYSACVCFGNIGRQLALDGSQQDVIQR